MNDGDEPASPTGEELNAWVEKLTDLLLNQPAITCPITFKWRGNEELAASAATKVRLYAVLLRDRHPDADFSSLKGITFHHDYEEGLKEASGKGDAGPEPTREAGGYSVGMLVRAPDGNQLVMDEDVALALASDDEAHNNWAQQIVRHELCHVIDHGFKADLDRRNGAQVAFSGVDAHMAPLACALWDEFYANKYSCGPWSTPRIFLDLLNDVVPPAKTAVTSAILSYRTSHDFESLMYLACPKVKFVAQCFGYAAGAVAGLDTTIEAFAPDVLQTLETHRLRDAWYAAFNALQALDARRGDWESSQDIRALFPACIRLFQAFGLHYRVKGDGVRVDVPMTDDTNPLLV